MRDDKTNRPTRRGVLLVGVLVALALPATAAGDLGILKLSTSVARPGDLVTVVAGGFLGPKPWRPMPVVMIPAARAPKPVPFRDGFRSPIARRADLRPPRYRVIGEIRRWHAVDETGVNATGRLRFRVPCVPAGRYVFALFCDRCWPGPAGSLVIDTRPVLIVRR
jgi:hypothetical protein